MELNEYQKLAQRTGNNSGKVEKIQNGCLGLCGESGECIDILKKWVFQSHELDRNKLAEELGDVLWYCVELEAGLGKTLDEIATANIEKLKKRYPQGFEAERSINREV